MHLIEDVSAGKATAADGNRAGVGVDLNWNVKSLISDRFSTLAFNIAGELVGFATC